MATPSRSTAVSTPKPVAGTPTRIMASPRPGFAARPFAGKSPAVKTPASAHGHSYNLSSSSQPSSTPIAAPILPDDLLALNSPAAALMASLSGHGRTPLPSGSGQEGLGISTLQPGASGLESTAARNIEAEKLARLREVVDALKTRLAGPGITRAGIERLAQINGFALLPDEDSVNIAGNHCVDLEITFDDVQKDEVKTVMLNINAAGSGDVEGEEHKKLERASEILKRNLTQSEWEAGEKPWKGLEGFAENLGYLSQLDHLSSKVNCFAAVSGLHRTFQAVWEEEKKRLSWRQGLKHLSQGAVGRSSMDGDGKLGLRVDYWSEQHQLHHTDEDTEAADSRPHVKGVQPDLWKLNVSCETGSPSLTTSYDWLAPEVAIADSLLGASDPDAANELQIAWREPTIGDTAGTKDDQDAMMDNLAAILEPSNVRFVATLGPSVVLPLSTILNLNAQLPLVEVDQTKVVTYQEKLDSLGDQKATKQGWAPQWSQEVTVIDEKGNVQQRQHSYSLYSATPIWCYAVDKLVFNHPRQISVALPTLRQYALLWTLLRKLVSKDSKTSKKAVPEVPATPAKTATVRIRSNRALKENAKAQQAKLNGLLSKSTGQNPPRGDALPITVEVDVVTDPLVPMVNLILPVGRGTTAFGKIEVKIGLNAKVAISSTLGEQLDRVTAEKMGRVLQVSEDLGILVEWTLEKVGAGQMVEE